MCYTSNRSLKIFTPSYSLVMITKQTPITMIIMGTFYEFRNSKHLFIVKKTVLSRDDELNIM